MPLFNNPNDRNSTKSPSSNIWATIVESDLLRWTLFVCIGVILLLWLVKYWRIHWIWMAAYWRSHWNPSIGYTDWSVYRDAGMRAAGGQSLYTPRPDYGPDSPLLYVFLYPPHFAAAISPLAGLSNGEFYRLWHVLMHIAFFGYAACLARLALGRWSPVGMMLAAITLLFLPGVVAAVLVGQVEPLVWACFGLALTTRWPGTALAVAALIKIHPLWPLAVLGSRVSMRILWSSGFVIFAGLLVGCAVCGLSAYEQWLKAVPPVLGQGTFDPYNKSLSFAILRVLQWVGLWQYAGGPLPVGPRAFLLIVSIVAPGFAWRMTRRISAKLQCACVGVAAVLFAPICWHIYLPICLVPIAVWIGERRGQSPNPALLPEQAT